MASAPNIKNKNTNKAVMSALKSISYKLSVLSNIPTNGMVLCSGTFLLNKQHL